ncbi:MAG: uracil-DNA glycosylase family protein [Planctomycetota bacterium]
MHTKQQQYEALVEKRKACRLCVGLSNPAEPALRQFDSSQIGPWSRLHGDLDAQLMIVGQDWGGVKYYQDNKGFDRLDNPTMRNLEKLLHHIGFKVSVTSYADQGRGLFLTNAVLCLKNGGLQARIEPEWAWNCGSNFLRQQIEIVRPKIVMALGAFALHAVLRAFEQPVIKLQDAIKDTRGAEILDGVRLFAAYHCGNGTVNRNRDLKQQLKDWKRIQKFLQ